MPKPERYSFELEEGHVFSGVRDANGRGELDSGDDQPAVVYKDGTKWLMVKGFPRDLARRAGPGLGGRPRRAGGRHITGRDGRRLHPWRAQERGAPCVPGRGQVPYSVAILRHGVSSR